MNGVHDMGGMDGFGPIAPEENELVVNRLLGSAANADVVGLTPPGCAWCPGVTSWRDKTLDARLDRAVRILPDDLWDGFFLCLLVKR